MGTHKKVVRRNRQPLTQTVSRQLAQVGEKEKMLPSLILLGLFMLSLGVSIANHGKPRSDENAITTLISIAIWLVLLYWGGFFNALVSAIKGGG